MATRVSATGSHVGEASSPRPGRASALPTLTEAFGAAIPVVAIASLGIFAPSVFSTPVAFFVYAFVQAGVFLVVIRFFDLYEREPLSLIVLMALWGGTGAVFLALVGNTFVFSRLDEDVWLVFGPAISAPPVEEAAKGIALIAAFQVSRWVNRRFGVLEFEGVTDGIVYGAAVGMGFAVAEDIHYFLEFSSLNPVLGFHVFVERVDFFGGTMLGHSLFTAAFGAGLGLATWSPSRLGRWGFPALGLLLAMLLHATWNGFDALVLLWRYGWDATVDAWGCIGWGRDFCGAEPGIAATFETADHVMRAIFYGALASFAVAVAFWLRHQRHVIRLELAEEAGAGLITQEELALIPRYWARSWSYWQLLRAGRLEHWRLVRRIHNELVDLAFLKWRLKRVGGDPAEVERRRRRIASLQALLATAL